MRPVLASFALVGLLGCKAPSEDTLDTAVAAPTCGGADATRMHWVIDSLMFARVQDGVSHGFDLDSLSSTAGGADGCGRADFTSPTGVSGIDNAFGEVIPALENTEFVSAEALINDTIRTGELMLLVSADDVDDPTEDDCVGVRLSRAVGEPMLGTDGSFLAGQTMTIDPTFAAVSLPEMQIAGGSIEGRPVTATLPVQVLNAALEFELIDGGVRLDQHADGTATGVLAGGVDIATLLRVATEEGIAAEVGEILDSVLGIVADLSPQADGTCDQLSVTFEFTATPVYLFDDE